MNKKCSKCHKIKILECFNKDKRRKDGVTCTCKSCQCKQSAIYRNNNRLKCRRMCMDNMRRNVISWIGFIPKETNCECCGNRIYFQGKERKKTIHFDHRHGSSSLIKIPVPWLWKHVFNEKNKSIWESCDFGMLCGPCNFKLPTDNREEWLNNVIKYVRNSNKMLHADTGSKNI